MQPFLVDSDSDAAFGMKVDKVKAALPNNVMVLCFEEVE